jgi:hypothetical protein
MARAFEEMAMVRLGLIRSRRSAVRCMLLSRSWSVTVAGGIAGDVNHTIKQSGVT